MVFLFVKWMPQRKQVVVVGNKPCSPGNYSLPGDKSAGPLQPLTLPDSLRDPTSTHQGLICAAQWTSEQTAWSNKLLQGSSGNTKMKGGRNDRNPFGTCGKKETDWGVGDGGERQKHLLWQRSNKWNVWLRRYSDAVMRHSSIHGQTITFLALSCKTAASFLASNHSPYYTDIKKTMAVKALGHWIPP